MAQDRLTGSSVAQDRLTGSSVAQDQLTGFSVAQDRLTGLALTSFEDEVGRTPDYIELLKRFADRKQVKSLFVKVRSVAFYCPYKPCRDVCTPASSVFSNEVLFLATVTMTEATKRASKISILGRNICNGKHLSASLSALGKKLSPDLLEVLMRVCGQALASSSIHGQQNQRSTKCRE
ncbi:hypothetical protein NDU88_009453 [Pleurodeles waltl]|uniref:Uncharacterized protein n=1 Tax=Pleurodeles waltl TaxID=8319 RepID=A0AAV7P834_PLEWA|nr:hypothetical protein NDU88_009453 [Pleurodeles waltl]